MDVRKDQKSDQHDEQPDGARVGRVRRQILLQSHQPGVRRGERRGDGADEEPAGHPQSPGPVRVAVRHGQAGVRGVVRAGGRQDTLVLSGHDSGHAERSELLLRTRRPDGRRRQEHANHQELEVRTVRRVQLHGVQLLRVGFHRDNVDAEKRFHAGLGDSVRRSRHRRRGHNRVRGPVLPASVDFSKEENRQKRRRRREVRRGRQDGRGEGVGRVVQRVGRQDGNGLVAELPAVRDRLRRPDGAGGLRGGRRRRGGRRPFARPRHPVGRPCARGPVLRHGLVPPGERLLRGRTRLQRPRRVRRQQRLRGRRPAVRSEPVEAGRGRGGRGGRGDGARRPGRGSAVLGRVRQPVPEAEPGAAVAGQDQTETGRGGRAELSHRRGQTADVGHARLTRPGGFLFPELRPARTNRNHETRRPRIRARFRTYA